MAASGISQEMNTSTVGQQPIVTNSIPRSILSSGLSAPFSQLVELFAPATSATLGTAIHMAHAALVLGDRGSRKQQLLEAVTSRLGLHLIQHNCFDLLGNTHSMTVSC